MMRASHFLNFLCFKEVIPLFQRFFSSIWAIYYMLLSHKPYSGLHIVDFCLRESWGVILHGLKKVLLLN